MVPAMTEAPTMLITLMGRDRPGVTAEMFRTLTAFPVDVLDIEQIVLRGRLVLGILVTLHASRASSPQRPRRGATELGMDVEIVTGVR